MKLLEINAGKMLTPDHHEWLSSRTKGEYLINPTTGRVDIDGGLWLETGDTHFIVPIGNVSGNVYGEQSNLEDFTNGPTYVGRNLSFRGAPALKSFNGLVGHIPRRLVIDGSPLGIYTERHMLNVFKCKATVGYIFFTKNFPEAQDLVNDYRNQGRDALEAQEALIDMGMAKYARF